MAWNLPRMFAIARGPVYQTVMNLVPFGESTKFTGASDGW